MEHTRSHVQAAALDADPVFRALTGNIVIPGFTAPKLAWVRAAEPAIWDKVALVLLPKDYLRLWLTGEPWPRCRMRRGQAARYRRARLSDDLLTKTGLAARRCPGWLKDRHRPVAFGRTCGRLGDTGRHAGCGRRGRQCGLGRRCRRGETGRGRSCRWEHRASCSPPRPPISRMRPARCTPSATPCRHLAPDGGHPCGGRCAELVCATGAQGSAALTADLGPLMAPGRACSCPIWGRADAAQRCPRPRRLAASGSRGRPRHPDPHGAGRGDPCLPRQFRCADGDRHPDQPLIGVGAARGRTIGCRRLPPHLAWPSNCPSPAISAPPFGAARLGIWPRLGRGRIGDHTRD